MEWLRLTQILLCETEPWIWCSTSASKLATTVTRHPSSKQLCFYQDVCTIPVTIPKHPHTFSEDESVNLRWRVRLRKSRNLSIELRRSADCSLMTRSRQFGGSWVVSHVVSAVIPLALPLCSADKQFGIQEAQTHGGCRSRAHRAKCSAKFVLVRWNEMLRSFGGMWGNSWGYDGVTSIWNRVLKDGRCSCNARATIPDGATEAWSTCFSRIVQLSERSCGWMWSGVTQICKVVCSILLALLYFSLLLCTLLSLHFP